MNVIAIPLPDGRWIALTPADFSAALAAAAEIVPAAGPVPSGNPEVGSCTTGKLLTSAQMAELLNVHSTTVETMAHRSEIPSIRIGKALRFSPSEVVAALPATRKSK
jgi:excisionase family DNA binding protein